MLELLRIHILRNLLDLSHFEGNNQEIFESKAFSLKKKLEELQIAEFKQDRERLAKVIAEINAYTKTNTPLLPFADTIANLLNAYQILSTHIREQPSLSHAFDKEQYDRLSTLVRIPLRNQQNCAILNTFLASFPHATKDEKQIIPPTKTSYHKPLNRFLIVKKLAGDNTFSSYTLLVKKLKPDGTLQKNKKTGKDNLYFLKLSRNSEDKMQFNADAEVIGQEFFRLMLRGSQPKTRRVTYPNGQTIGVISKAVPGFLSLGAIHKAGQKLSIEIQKKLPPIIEVARVVKEADLNAWNVGLDEMDNLAKIDGNQIFAPYTVPSPPENKNQPIQEVLEKAYLHAQKTDDITARDLQSSPAIIDLSVSNFLAVIQHCENFSDKKNDLDISFLQVDPDFQNLSHTIRLEMMLIDDEYIQHFVSQYTDNKETLNKLSDFLKHRIHLLKREAIKTEDFRDFLLDEKATSQAVHNITEKLTHFTTLCKKPLFELKEANQVKKKITENLTLIKEAAIQNTIKNPETEAAPALDLGEPKSTTNSISAIKSSSPASSLPILTTNNSPQIIRRSTTPNAPIPTRHDPIKNNTLTPSKLADVYRQYINHREKSDNYFGLFGYLNGMSKNIKISAAKKMIASLENKHLKISFSDLELEALRDGRLGVITTKLDRDNLLPDAFLQAEYIRVLMHLGFDPELMPKRKIS